MVTALRRSRWCSTRRCPPDATSAFPVRATASEAERTRRLSRSIRRTTCGCPTGGSCGCGSISLTRCPHRSDPQDRSEEHTSELQSRGHLVCRLLLEKKKKQ